MAKVLLPEAHFDVIIPRHKRLVAIDEELFHKLAAIADLEQVSPADLIASYLREKVS